MQTLEIELMIFLKAAGSGALLLFCYDVLRGVRRGLEGRIHTVRIGDLLFGIGSGFYLFFRIYTYNLGVLRGYIFLGVLLGMVIYHYTLGGPVLFCVSFLIKRLKFSVLWVKIFICKCISASGIMGFVKNGKNKKDKKKGKGSGSAR